MDITASFNPSKPTVYIIYDDNTCTYVGYSQHILTRLSTSYYNKRHVIKNTSRIDLYQFDDFLIAAKFELKMILELKPTENNKSYKDIPKVSYNSVHYFNSKGGEN